jgi:RNA polymerase sigma factor (sigma-70 family)
MAGGLSDRQLLERFAADRELSAEAAFEVLLLRHGPMVLRVCRNSLRDPNDVQDAFQATFLVLVRRRGALRQCESIGGWLYGVACRVAARARVEAARRRAAEERWGRLRVLTDVDDSPSSEFDDAEFGATIQREVRRLPSKYRAVIVLCYWEGQTQEQAAAQLGCPLGTVRSRLARARDLLRRRLKRRGLAPPAGLLASVVGSAGGSAATSRPSPVQSRLIDSTVHAAVRISSGRASSHLVSSVATSLAEHFLWRISMIKVSSMVAGLAVLTLAGYGTGLAFRVARQAGSDRQLGPQAAERPVPGGERAGPLSQLAKQAEAGKRPRERAASRVAQVHCPIQGPTSIVFIVPDGSAVKKGDRLCELDSAPLRDQLINQRITTESAKANHGNARIASENAQFALKAYRDDLFPIEKREFESDAKIAEAELALTGAVRKELENPAHSKLDRMRADLDVARARFALEKAKNRLHVLVDYTNQQRIRELAISVETTRSNELAKMAIVELEELKEKKLESQIAASTILAPIDGTVKYYVTGTPIEEGATVRERQGIMIITPAAGAGGEAR